MATISYSHEGSVLVLNERSSTASQSAVIASFSDFAAGSSCTRTPIGPCFAIACSIASTTSVSAGDIAVGGGTLPVTLTFQPSSGFYSSSSLPAGALNWAAGASVSIAAPGASVPAFSASVVMPDFVTFTAPALSATSALAVARSSDLTVSWSSAATQSIVLEVKTSSGAASLLCVFASGAGNGVVPAAALSALPPGAATLSGSTASLQFLTVGSYAVTVGAFANGRNASGDFYDGALMLQ